MGLLDKLFGSKQPANQNISESKHQRIKNTDPFTILPVCMGDICTQLVKHFGDEHYKWNENEGVKLFECLILSKFLMDRALFTFSNKIENIRIEFYLKMLDSTLKTMMEINFPALKAAPDKTKAAIKSRLELYGDIMSENSHPQCWQLIAGACTGIDYYTQNDLFALINSSLVLPQLLIFAQDSLKMVIKE